MRVAEARCAAAWLCAGFAASHVALAGAAAQEPAGAAAAAAAALARDGALVQAYGALGRERWALDNVAVIALRAEDLEQLRARGAAHASELAARFAGAVLLVPLELNALTYEVSAELLPGLSSKEELLCLLSPTIVTQVTSFHEATIYWRNCDPWWPASAPSPPCDASFWIVDPAQVAGWQGNLGNVSIRSGPNPMAALAESVWGVVIFLIYPSFLFAALAAYSLRVLQSRAPPVMVHKVILASNAAIMSSLVVLYAVGGGVFGFLLPDMRRKIKFFNYASLAASSSAIDLLMGLFIGAALQQKKSEATLPEATQPEATQPEATQPSRVGKACFAFLVALDLFTGLSLGTTWFPVMVTEEVLPGLLIVAELVCSAFLTWRCRALQVRVALLAQDAPAAKHTLKNLHIRLVVAGYLSAAGALMAAGTVVAYTEFKVARSPGDVAAIVTVFVASRACTSLGQLVFSDREALRCIEGSAARVADESAIRPKGVTPAGATALACPPVHRREE